MMYFDELWPGDDFANKVRALVADFRVRFDLPKIAHLGIVVPDVDAACAELERTGLGPFFIARGTPDLWLESGEKKPFHGKLAWAYRAGIQIELLDPGTGSDFYRRDVDPAGRLRIQHLGFAVSDVDAVTKRLTDAGMTAVVEGCLHAGPILNRWFYVDALRETGFYLDIYRFSLIGITLRMPPRVIRALGHVQKWTDKRRRVKP